jgi:hypothetical protein
MKKIILLSILITLFSCSSNSVVNAGGPGGGEAGSRAVYDELGLADAGLSFDAFQKAFEGYNSVAGLRQKVLTVIDFTKPSTERRMWVIDMTSRQVLFHTWVAHGQGSGDNYATRFSNVGGSHQSSLGLYLTGSTYNGGNGYSLLLEGLEPGVNDHARRRSIVVHGAPYADPSVIASAGRLGRSWGCPALPPDVTRPIIDSIKDGSVLYIYGKNA